MASWEHRSIIGLRSFQIIWSNSRKKKKYVGRRKWRENKLEKYGKKKEYHDADKIEVCKISEREKEKK